MITFFWIIGSALLVFSSLVFGDILLPQISEKLIFLFEVLTTLATLYTGYMARQTKHASLLYFLLILLASGAFIDYINANLAAQNINNWEYIHIFNLIQITVMGVLFIYVIPQNILWLKGTIFIVCMICIVVWVVTYKNLSSMFVISSFGAIAHLLTAIGCIIIFLELKSDMRSIKPENNCLFWMFVGLSFFSLCAISLLFVPNSIWGLLGPSGRKLWQLVHGIGSIIKYSCIIFGLMICLKEAKRYSYI